VLGPVLEHEIELGEVLLLPVDHALVEVGGELVCFLSV